MSTSFVFREMQIKLTIYYIISIQLPECKKSKNTMCWRTHRSRGSLFFFLMGVKLVQPLWKTILCNLVKLNIHVFYDLALSFLYIGRLAYRYLEACNSKKLK